MVLDEESKTEMGRQGTIRYGICRKADVTRENHIKLNQSHKDKYPSYLFSSGVLKFYRHIKSCMYLYKSRSETV